MLNNVWEVTQVVRSLSHSKARPLSLHSSSSLIGQCDSVKSSDEKHVISCDLKNDIVWSHVLVYLFYVSRKTWKLNDLLGDRAGGTDGEWWE